MLFDNSLNDKRFLIDIRVENGYEEGCTRGARIQTDDCSVPSKRKTPWGDSPRGFVVSGAATATNVRAQIASILRLAAWEAKEVPDESPPGHRA